MPKGVVECISLVDKEISNQRSKEDPYKISMKNSKEEKYREGYLDGLEKANEILNEYEETHQE